MSGLIIVAQSQDGRGGVGGKINMDMDMAKFEQPGCRKPRVGTRVRNGHLVAVAGEWNGALSGEAGPTRKRDCNKGGAQQ